MPKKTSRTKTGYKNIYYNEGTQKYDVKYNYTEYSVQAGKNIYRSKWVYHLDTLAQAKLRLAELQAKSAGQNGGELSLQGAFELWRTKALSQNYSPVTVENTANFMRIIYRFIPADTLIKHLDEDAYYRFCAGMRAAGYSEETLFSLNATFRKILRYAYKKRFLAENMLACAENLKTKRKQEHRMLQKREFDLLDAYFCQKNRRYQLLIHLLYYTGMRIGEALALTYADFEAFDGDGRRYAGAFAPAAEGAAGPAEGAYRGGMRIRISKSYVSRMKLEKDTKNHKSRTVPLCAASAKLYLRLRQEHLGAGGAAADKIFGTTYQAVNTAVKRACERVGIAPATCHDFRHTFISNLIRKNVPLSVMERVTGNTQEMILRRYSHAFENDDVMILHALREL